MEADQGERDLFRATQIAKQRLEIQQGRLLGRTPREPAPGYEEVGLLPRPMIQGTRLPQ